MSFCQICRHEVPGHEPNCPVLTGEPQRGVQWLSGVSTTTMNSDPDQIQLRYHRGTIYWQMPNARIKMKSILVGAYLGVSLAIVLACIPAWYAQAVPDPAWVKAHQSTYLWLAGAYIALVLFVRALIRWQGLGIMLVVNVLKFVGGLFLIGVAGLFFGYVVAGFMLLGCLGVFDCCCEHERQREKRIIVSRRPELPAAGLSLSRGEKRLLQASVIAASLLVWILLGAWYMNDARTVGFVPPEALADPPPGLDLSHSVDLSK
jgi:hypothetical protein